AGGPPGCSPSDRAARRPGGCGELSRRRVLVDLQVDDGRIAPQPLERVEGAVLGVLDVDDDVAVVQQHPAGVALALAAQRLAAALAEQRLLDAVDDRGDLPLGLPAAHEEHVGDDDQLGDVQADHLVGELVGGGLSGHPGEVEGFFRGAHAAASSRTGWTWGVPDGTGRASSAADASPGPMTPVSSSTTSTPRAIAMSAHTSHTRARPPLFSGRCSTLPSNRGAGRGSGASVTESSPSSTPS